MTNKAKSATEMSLREALETMVMVAREAHDHWDADRDAKVGKYLAAMGGSLRGYRADLDAAHAALARAVTLPDTAIIPAADLVRHAVEVTECDGAPD